MSEDETIRKKVIDVNINVGKEGSEEFDFEKATEQADEMSALLGLDVEVAENLEEFNDQKHTLRVALGKAIAGERERREKENALAKAGTEAGSSATGMTKLTPAQTGADEGTDLGTHEFDSPSQMLEFLRKQKNRILSFENATPFEKAFKKQCQQHYDQLIAKGIKEQSEQHARGEWEFEGTIDDMKRGKGRFVKKR